MREGGEGGREEGRRENNVIQERRCRDGEVEKERKGRREGN